MSFLLGDFPPGEAYISLETFCQIAVTLSLPWGYFGRSLSGFSSLRRAIACKLLIILELLPKYCIKTVYVVKRKAPTLSRGLF
jgi:hypothetical protein